MVRVGVQPWSEIDAQFQEDSPPITTTPTPKLPEPAPHASHLVAPALERRQSKNPSSYSSSNVRNAAEVWKGQLTKRLLKRTDLLLNPPKQEDVPVATP